MTSRGRILLAAALLLSIGLRGALPRLYADWRSRNAGTGEVDLVTREAQPYEDLVASLPARGTIGYLQPGDWPGADAQRRYYLAQYMLTPRLVVMGASPEFVIVSPEAWLQDERSGSPTVDPRLVGFSLFKQFPSGFRIFRRAG